MSHSLPRLTLSTCTSSFFTYLSCLSNNLTDTHTRLLVHDEYLPCDVPRQSGGSTQVSSLTGYEPNVIETEAIDPEDLEPRRIELDRNLGTDPYQIQERFVRENHQNLIAEDVVEGFGKVGAEKSYVQSQMHSDYDSAASIAESDLEDGELRRIATSSLYMQDREDCMSSRISTAPEKPAAMIQERGVGEGLMSNSSQETRASVKPAAMFFTRKRRTIKSSIFKNANPSNL